MRDFLKYNSEEKIVSGEERPSNIDKLGNIKIYTVLLANHKINYDFEDSDDVTDNFLLNVKSKFIPSIEVSVKCSFLLPARVKTGMQINNIAYWSKEVYLAKYFNNYLFFSLKRNI